MRLELTTVAAVLVAVTLVACDDDAAVVETTSGSGGSGGASASASNGTGGIPQGTPISAKATVKFKSKARMLKDFQNALELTSAELCREVGVLDCGEFHGVALGGTDAYQAGVYRPLAETAATTTIAVDRIALSGCQMRAHLDFKDLGSATIFKLTLNGEKLDDVDDASVRDAIAELYHRIHLREPKPAEIAHLRQLYTEIESGGSAQPAKDWAALSCYAVLTTMESVFY